MSGETLPEHWSFNSEAVAELRLQSKRAATSLESLAAAIAADEPGRRDEERDLVERRHVKRAASLLIRDVHTTGPQYHVFISYKSDDQGHVNH
jgi:hypothetical protein